MPFLNRRRRERELLKQIIRDSHDLVRSAADATAEVRTDIAHLRASVDDLVDAIKNLKKETSVSLRAVVGRWVTIAILAIMSATIAVVATTAFADVDSEDMSFTNGTFEFDVVGAPGPGDAGTPQAFIAEHYSSEYNLMTYYVAVAKKYVGRRFALLLTGTAVISDVRDGETLQEHPFRAESTKCIGAPALGRTCEAVYGNVPALTGDSLAYPFTLGCGPQPQSMNQELGTDYVLFSIAGQGEAKENLGFFHAGITMPGEGLPRASDGSFYGLKVPRPLTKFSVDTCRILDLSGPSEATSFTKSPTTTFGFSYIFHDESGGAVGTIDITIRRRSAEQWGNLGAVTAGGLAGLAVGLLPLASEATLARRRQARRQR